jgi:hypothetical protein
LRRNWFAGRRYLGMANDRFYGIWEPRIGRDAADILKRRAWICLIPILFLVTLVVVAIAVSPAVYGLAMWPIAVVSSGAWIILLVRTNRKLAIAIGLYLGLQVKSVPSFSGVRLFDRWLKATKAGVPMRELRLHGWSTGIFVPPK